MSTEQVPLNPVTEEEIMGVRDVFTKMADNMIAATKLYTQVQDLSHQVGDLSKQVERLRSQNDWLDEQLTTIRKQRDDAISEAQSAKEAMHTAERDRDFHKARSEADHATVEALQAQLERAHKDHDDAEMRATEYEDSLKKANDKLVKLQDIISPLPVPTPTATVVPITQSYDPPSPVAEQVQGQEPERQYPTATDPAPYRPW